MWSSGRTAWAITVLYHAIEDFDRSTEITEMDEQVELYIRKQMSPQKEIVRRVRKIILRTFPEDGCAVV